MASLVRTICKKNVGLTHQRDPRACPEDLGAAPSCTERRWVQCCSLPGVNLFLQYLPLTFHFPEGLWASWAPSKSQSSSCCPCNPHSRENLCPSTCHPEKSLPPAKLFLPLKPYMSSMFINLHLHSCFPQSPLVSLLPCKLPGCCKKKLGWDAQRFLFAATPHRYSGCSSPCWWASSTEFSCIKNCTCQRGKTNDNSNNVEEHPLNIWEGWIMNHFYQGVQEALEY